MPSLTKKKPRGSLSMPESDSTTLESKLHGLLASGRIARVTKRAITRQREAGLAITFKRGTQIIRQHADGREEVLGTVDRIKFKRPKGVRAIGR